MRIRITSVPEGEAPLGIRQDWVGLVLPTVERDEPRSGRAAGIVSGIPVKTRGFTVKTDKAIAALRQAGKARAADWWAQWQEDFKQYGTDTLVFDVNWCKALPMGSLADLHESILNCIEAADNEDIPITDLLGANHILWKWLTLHGLFHRISYTIKGPRIQPFWNLLNSYGVELTIEQRVEIVSQFHND
jgi:hypothetical protein